MRFVIASAIVALGLLAARPLAAGADGDWPQWRGPQRTGVGDGGPKLATTWPAGGPVKLWESEPVPRCDTDGGGGYGSVTVADGRAYLFTSWGHKEPIATSQRAASQSATAPASAPADAAKFWLRTTDVILCLDAATGKTLWKKEFPGIGLKHMDLYNGSSSTVTIANGRCYAVGTAGVYCLDAKTGEEIWQHSAPPSSSSFLVFDKLAVAQLEALKAFDADTGQELWSVPKIKSHTNSPVLWRSGGKARIICNTPFGGVACVDPQTGQVLWNGAPGGEGSTPSVAGDYMVILAEVFQRSLVCYKLTEEKAEKLWSIPALHDQCASAIIYKDHVYAYANQSMPWGKVNRLICADLATGKLVQDLPRGEAYWASPVIVDDKLFFLEGKTFNVAINLTCFDAAPDHFVQLGQAKVDCSLCISPAIADGKLYLRQLNCVACYRLTPDAATQPGLRP
jgi:outer membrane protein assembly factor BamB